MKIQIRWLIMFWCFISCFQLFSQKNNVQIYTAYSIGKIDKRYDFLYDQFPALVETVESKINDNTPDDEYSIGVGYHRKLNKRLSVGIDLGYAQLVQDFLLPASGQSFFNAQGEKLYWRHKSFYHMLQLAPRVQFLIIDKNINAGLNLQVIGNMSFKKVVPESNLSKNKTEYFSTEVYPGLTLGYWRIHVNIAYRALHWKYRDDAIVNNGLNPDSYNPMKWRFTLSYDILRW